jgi:hypothetical protein
MKKVKLLLFGILGILILSNETLAVEAKQPGKMKASDAIRAPARIVGPDLIVNRLQILDDCTLRITIKNIGTAGVPDSAYGTTSSSVGFIVNIDGTTRLGGWLDTLDASKALKTPGAHAAWIWRKPLPEGSRDISVEIDHSNKLAEVDETNNLTNKTNTCR